MSVATASPVRLEDLQAGDQVTIRDGKQQELTGKVQVYVQSKMFIRAFGADIVFAKWVESKIDPGTGTWKGVYKIIDFVLPLPL